MRTVLAEVWTRTRQLADDRVEVLERTAQRVTARTATPGELDEARSLAHKLAGALGTFGVPAGTDAARVCEAELLGGDPDPERFARAVAALRVAVDAGPPG